MLVVEIITNPEDWASYREEWNRFAGDKLTRSYDWLRAWWDGYHHNYQLFVLRASRDGETIAFFPLARQQKFVHGQTICFLGSGKACTDDVGILVSPQHFDEVAKTFADFLTKLSYSPGHHWDHLDFDGVRSDDVPMNLFLSRLEQNATLKIERRPSLNCWKVDISAGWEPYVASLSKRVRKMWGDTKRYLESESTFQVASGERETIEFVETIAELHQRRWQERGIVGCFGTDNFESFLKQLLSRLSEPNGFGNRPFVTLVKINNEPASGVIGFIYQGNLNVYLTGMSPEFFNYRPGWHASFCTIREAANLGCKMVDFMRGDEDYKPRLGAESHPQERWIIASPRIISKLRNKAYYTAIGIRDLTKQIMPRSATQVETPAKQTRS